MVDSLMLMMFTEFFTRISKMNGLFREIQSNHCGY